MPDTHSFEPENPDEPVTPGPPAKFDHWNKFTELEGYGDEEPLSKYLEEKPFFDFFKKKASFSLDDYGDQLE